MEFWYALHTKPRAEARVDHALTARGFNTYLPMLPQANEGHAEPLFPTYLFVYCDLETIDISQLQWVPGLSHILSFGGKAAVVPEEAIGLVCARLEELSTQGGQDERAGRRFEPGEEVVIETGPLAGMRGIFQGPAGARLSGAARVQILIHFLGEANRAEVTAGALRSAATEDAENKPPAWGWPAALNPPAGEAAKRRRFTRGKGRRVNYDKD
jgi:transcriptional antiterminator RfaH